jgi:hypothetical protein
MPSKQHARQLGADRAGLDDFSRAADKSGLAIPPITELRQAAEHRLRRQRHAQAVHRLGPRVLFELLDELCRHHLQLGTDIDRRLEAYAARLTPAMLTATGGDRLARLPLRVVGRP